METIASQVIRTGILPHEKLVKFCKPHFEHGKPVGVLLEFGDGSCALENDDGAFFDSDFLNREGMKNLADALDIFAHERRKIRSKNL